MSTVTLGSKDPIDLYVEDSGGDGRPVVLIHGWPLTADAWADQVPALVDAGHRVITYDRRGFGRSDSGDAYDYDALSGDLDVLLNHLDLRGAVLVGFSMGGGEVARQLGTRGDDRLAGVVFAAAVPPYLEATADNPDGPLDDVAIKEMKTGLADDPDGFYDQFTTDFFTADGEVRVSEAKRTKAVEMAGQADLDAALACIDSFARTDFRDDLSLVRIPTLVIHGDADEIVPLEASGARTHEALPNSRLHVVEGGPHGINVSHPDEFNRALLDFIDGL
ncbi:alpha/beta fold hydrolase [Salsipaludibacter albus]|uniref:alpha/beta fold hydrolase n=1 Tax=Salsipaludibacter albus TaxID=2849650 RepID=UPI001EE3A84C|nr:alpha/beta hydrolase [Salsipaludibacter albus]MBY5162323.1 alpha/beta hydrolase [Salsipaludibacter albus]